MQAPEEVEPEELEDEEDEFVEPEEPDEVEPEELEDEEDEFVEPEEPEEVELIMHIKFLLQEVPPEEEEGTQAGDLIKQDPKPIGGQQIAFPELHWPV